ncbi:MAG: glutamate racemase [Rikenellaceae bacterium]
MNNNPIAVFDSGLGGLSVWTELRRGLKNESIIYFGDGKNCPYGGREDKQILEFVDQAVQLMIERGAKLIVLACNTATAVAVDYLRATYDLPFVGLEPAVKPAAINTKTGKIGILATETSLEGKLYKETSAKYSTAAEIISRVGEGFVQLVEQSKEDTPEAYQTVKRAIEPMLMQDIDHLVLGCTHYPFLKNAINKAIEGRDIKVINPSRAIERRVEQLLKQNNIAAESTHSPQYEFYTNANQQYLERIIEKSTEALTLLSEL